MSRDRVLAHLAQHRDAHVDQLVEFLRIPSISSVSEHSDDVRRAATFVANELEQLGLQTEIIDRGGHPLIYAESEQRSGRKTLLFYGHYDVQPVDPTSRRSRRTSPRGSSYR